MLRFQFHLKKTFNFTEKTILYQIRNCNPNKRIFYGFLIIFIFAIALPTLFFKFIFDQSKIDKDHTCNILLGYRIPCGYENTTYESCTSVNCCFNDNTKQCYHTLPSKYQYESTDTKWKNGFQPKLNKSPYGKDNDKSVYLELTPINENTVSFSINNKPFTRRNIPIGNEDKYNFKGTIYTNEMGVEILRKSTGVYFYILYVFLILFCEKMHKVLNWEKQFIFIFSACIC